MWHFVVLLNFTAISEEYTASIFRFEENRAYSQQQIAACFLLAACLVYASALKERPFDSAGLHDNTLQNLLFSYLFFYSFIFSTDLGIHIDQLSRSNYSYCGVEQ
jgi:hypothetical protein